MSQLPSGSDVAVAISLPFNREQLQADLASARSDVQQWVSDVSQLKVEIPVRARDELTAAVDKIIADLQATRQVVIPVVAGNVAGGGGGGLPPNTVAGGGGTVVPSGGSTLADLLNSYSGVRATGGAPAGGPLFSFPARAGGAGVFYGSAGSLGSPGGALARVPYVQRGGGPDEVIDVDWEGPSSANLTAEDALGENGFNNLGPPPAARPAAAARRGRMSYFERRLLFGIGIYGTQQLYNTTREYGVASTLAAGDAAGMAQAELGLARGVGQFPLLGTIAQLATDPIGQNEMGTRLALQQAGEQDAAYGAMRGVRQFATDLSISASIASQPAGYLRDRAAIQEQTQQRRIEIADQSLAYGKAAASTRRQAEQAAQEEFMVADRATSEYFDYGQEERIKQRLFDRQRAAQQQEGQVLARGATLHGQMLAGLNAESLAKIEDLDTRRFADIGSISLQTEISRMRTVRHSDEAALRAMRGTHSLEEGSERDPFRRRMLAERDRAEEIELQGSIARERGYEANRTAADIRVTEDTAALSTMRASGLTRRAGDIEYKRQLQEEVQALRDRAAASKDAAEGQLLLNQASARETAMPTLIAARNRMEDFQEYVARVGVQGRINALDAGLSPYAQSRQGMFDQSSLAIAEANRSGQTQLAGMLSQLGARQLLQLERQHDLSVQSLYTDVAVSRLRTEGRTEEADALSLSRQTQTALAANAGDPEMQAAIRARAGAQAQSALAGPTYRAADAMGVYENVLRGAFRGGGRDRSRDILNDLVRHRDDGGGGGGQPFGNSALDAAASKLDQAAQKILDAEPILVADE